MTFKTFPTQGTCPLSHLLSLSVPFLTFFSPWNTGWLLSISHNSGHTVPASLCLTGGPPSCGHILIIHPGPGHRDSLPETLCHLRFEGRSLLFFSGYLRNHLCSLQASFSTHTHTHTNILMVKHPLCRCQGNKRKMIFESSQVSVVELMGRAENRFSYR